MRNERVLIFLESNHGNHFNIVWSSPKLDGKLDYNYWEVLVFTHLKACNIWSLVDLGLQEGADTAT